MCKPTMPSRLSPLLLSPKRLTLGLTGAWLACVGAPAQANSPELAQLPLEQLMGMRMVKAASRFEQLVNEAPAAASVLDASDIRQHGWRSLGDALASLPGLYVTDDRNYTYLGARGFLRPGDYNSRFILMIDGVRTNDSTYDQAMLGNEGLVDMDMVQRIEFIPGAGSAMYGSSALFGVINVVTRDGNALAGPRAAASVGKHGERRLRASYGWHGQQGADLLMAASVLTSHGETLAFPESGQTGPESGVVRGRDGEQARQFLFKAGYGGFTLSANHVHRTKGLATGSYATMLDAPNRTIDAHGVAQLGYLHSMGPGLTLSAQALWGRADYLGYYHYPDIMGRPAPNVDGGRARWYGLNVHATFTRIAAHKILVGAEMQRDARRDQFNFDTSPYLSLLDDRRSANRRAVYVEDEWRLDEQLLVNLSMRHDHHGTGARSNNPRAAIVYRMRQGSTAKLIYGKAFRVPNAYEMYYHAEGEGGQLANPALAPERIATAEAVLEQAYGTGGHGRLSLFTYRMRGLISQQEDPDSGLLVFRNLDRARAIGLEASTEQVFASMARVRASYTWQRATDGDGQALKASPRQLAKLNVQLPLSAGRAWLGGELHCMTSRLTEHSRVGGYCVANLSLTSTRLSAGADLSVSLYNLADRRYADPAGPAFTQEALQRQRRSAVAKLVYRF